MANFVIAMHSSIADAYPQGMIYTVPYYIAFTPVASTKPYIVPYALPTALGLDEVDACRHAEATVFGIVAGVGEFLRRIVRLPLRSQSRCSQSSQRRRRTVYVASRLREDDEEELGRQGLSLRDNSLSIRWYLV